MAYKNSSNSKQKITWYENDRIIHETARTSISMSNTRKEVFQRRKNKKSQHNSSSKEIEEQKSKILEYIRQGYTYQDIGDMLHISPKTVRKRIQQMEEDGIVINYSLAREKSTNRKIATLSQEVVKEDYPKAKVHLLIQLYIKQNRLADAISLLDNYEKNNDLSIDEFQGISQIKATLQRQIRKGGLDER